MCACRTLRSNRISLHSDAISLASLAGLLVWAIFTATGEPRKRPITTNPKPPCPAMVGGRLISMSSVPTSQCSLTPIVAMSSSDFLSAAAPSLPGHLPHKLSMFWKTRSVAVEVLMLAVSMASDGAAPMSPATSVSSSMGPRLVGTHASSLGLCSTWLTPTRKCAEGALMATATMRALTLAKGSSRVAGKDCSSAVAAASRSVPSKRSRSPSAITSESNSACIGCPKKLVCLVFGATTRPSALSRTTMSTGSPDIISRPRAIKSRSAASCVARQRILLCSSCLRAPRCEKKQTTAMRRLMVPAEAGIFVPTKATETG
mmetsp:Transcript_10256/g.21030  ORF Transcript_10256/g.21030 Transcript_10256/m.21030 type:complete len:317 (+) Transcript_10256:357-1307(+)